MVRPSARTLHALLHRDVGALQLLRHARAAHPVHGRADRRRRASDSTTSTAARSTASTPSSVYLIGAARRLDRRPLPRPLPRRARRRHASSPLGHFCMAFPTLPFFYLGLVLIVLGTGLLKPNVSTHRRHALPQRTIRAATPASRSSTWASTSARSSRRSSAAASARRSTGTAASAPPASAWCSASSSTRSGRSTSSRSSREADAPTSSQRAEARPNDAAHAGGRRSICACIDPLRLRAHLLGRLRAGRIEPESLRRPATRLTSSAGRIPSSWFQSVEPLFVIILARRSSHGSGSTRSPRASSPVEVHVRSLRARPRLSADRSGREYFAVAGNRVSPLWLVGLYFLHAVGELRSARSVSAP